MLRCHCVVPAPVGRCRCLDCNIVLYCLLARCSTTVCALDSLSKYRHHGSTYVSEDGALCVPDEPPLVGRIPCLPVLHPRDKDHPLVRNRGIHYRASSKTEERASCESISPASLVPPPSPAPETGQSNRLKPRVPASRFLIRPIRFTDTPPLSR